MGGGGGETWRGGLFSRDIAIRGNERLVRTRSCWRIGLEVAIALVLRQITGATAAAEQEILTRKI